MARVKIHYRRPPDRVTVYENELVHSAADVTVTFMRATQLARPMVVDDKVVFENGAPAVWFTFPHADHDIGRFHTMGGVFTGIYANVLTPVEFVSPTEWHTTDLFVDVWIDRDGRAQILDEAELIAATKLGWVDAHTAASAHEAARRIVREHRNGTWPPPVVYDWPLERILEMDS